MKTRQRRRSAWRLGGASILVAALSSACNLDESGVPPPAGTLAYPIAVALSREPRPRTLFVANSNFDLTYSAGSVQAYDLTQLEQRFEACRAVNRVRPDSDASVEVPDYTTRFDAGLGDAGSVDGGTLDGSVDLDAGAPIDDAGFGSDASAMPPLDGLDAATADGGVDASGAGPIVLPADYTASSLGPFPEGALCDDEDAESGFERAGCCLRVGPDQLGRSTLDESRVGERYIDSFATGIAVSPDSSRLYVPISSRSRLVYLDIEPTGALGCGADQGRCTRGPERGRNDGDPSSDFPGQPSAIAVGRLGDLGITEAALGKSPETPIVVTAHEVRGLSLFVESGPIGPDGVMPASEPVLESVYDNRVSAPTSVTIDPRNRLIYVTSAGQNPYVQRFGVRVDRERRDPREPEPRELLYPSTAIELSGVAVSDDVRDVAIDPDDPTRLFALTRGSPQAVLFLRIDPTSARREARVTDAVRVGSGPSKLAYAVIDGRPFLFVSAYDARSIFVVDATTRELTTVIRNFSGPYDMALDSARRLLYVADFRTSVLRVVDLSGLVDRSRPRPGIIATIGAQKFKGSLR